MDACYALFLALRLHNTFTYRNSASSILIYYAKAFDCVDHNKLENSERDGNTRPPDLPPEKSVYSSGSNKTGCGTKD